MKQEITYSCGHSGIIYLGGKYSEREAKIAWLEESGLCPECYKASIANSKRAAYAHITTVICDLTGSEKQIAWANKIRDEKLADIATYLKKAEEKAESMMETLTDEQKADIADRFAKISATIVYMAQEITAAAWWIDNRNEDAYLLSKKVYRETVKAILEAEKAEEEAEAAKAAAEAAKAEEEATKAEETQPESEQEEKDEKEKENIMKKITFVRRDGFLGEREILYTGVSKVFNISSNWVLNSMNFATTAEDMDDEIIEEIESIIAGDTRDLCLSLDVDDLDNDDIEYLEDTIRCWGISPVYAADISEET